MNQSIEIKTTQNVTIEYELAGLQERAFAWALDLVLVTIIYYIFIAAISILWPQMGQWWGLFFGLMAIMFYFLYNVLFELTRRGQTLGKMALGIKVVRLDGKDPEWSDALLRTLLQFVDTFFSLGFVGGLLIKTTTKAQRLGDMAANTTLIKIKNASLSFRLSEILNISTLQNYQPLYPQVRQLSESDLIFVKNALTRYQQYRNDAHFQVLQDLVTKLTTLLDIPVRPPDAVNFLKTLLKDYIVLTR